MSRYLIDELRDVTESTKNALDLSSINYLYAPLQEIIDVLVSMSKTASSEKYPLVAIVADITERKGEREDMESEASLPYVIFATLSRAEWHADTRYTNSFKATLQPLYEEWIEQLGKHAEFYTEGVSLIPHKKTDRLSWGKSRTWTEHAIAVDNIDAIEVNDLEFYVRKKLNC